MSMTTLSETLTHQLEGQLGAIEDSPPSGLGVIMPQLSMVTALVQWSSGLVAWEKKLKLMTKKMGRSFTFWQCLWLACQVDLCETVRTKRSRRGVNTPSQGIARSCSIDRTVELSTFTFGLSRLEHLME